MKNLKKQYQSCVRNVVPELMLKILVIGDYGVGKTAIVRRYSEGTFTSNYKITIGAEFSLKNYMLHNRKRVNIQLWDIAGHERFGYMTRVFYKNASAAVIVFDLSRALTFDSIHKWLSDVRDKVTLNDGKNIPVVVLANKADIVGCKIHSDGLDRFCRKNNLVGWYETSAKQNINIEKGMGHLIRKTINMLKDGNPETMDNISLHRSPEKKFKLCC